MRLMHVVLQLDEALALPTLSVLRLCESLAARLPMPERILGDWSSRCLCRLRCICVR